MFHTIYFVPQNIYLYIIDLLTYTERQAGSQSQTDVALQAITIVIYMIETKRQQQANNNNKQRQQQLFYFL